MALLEAHRSAVRRTAAGAYSGAIIDEWAPAVIAPERVATFQRSIERMEELVVVAVNPGREIIGFGSIVPSDSELRALYVFIAAGLAVGAVPALLQRATIPVTVTLSVFALANIAAGYWLRNFPCPRCHKTFFWTLSVRGGLYLSNFFVWKCRHCGLPGLPRWEDV